MKQSKTGRVPAWVLSHLKRYGNCAIGRKIANELGDELLPLLREEGYVCELLTIDHSGEGKSGTTYLVSLTLNCVCPDTNNKSESHTKYPGQKHFTWSDGPLPWDIQNN